jgi:hypothetical protein
MRAFNVDEIDTWGQFHQHFAQIFWRQNVTRPNLTREKLLNSLSYEKCVCKMLRKLTPGVNPTKDCLSSSFFIFTVKHQCLFIEKTFNSYLYE